MRPEHALRRLAGVFQGLEDYVQTGAPVDREKLVVWARKQQEYIDKVLADAEENERIKPGAGRIHKSAKEPSSRGES